MRGMTNTPQETPVGVDAHNARVITEAVQDALARLGEMAAYVGGLVDDLQPYLPSDEDAGE